MKTAKLALTINLIIATAGRLLPRAKIGLADRRPIWTVQLSEHVVVLGFVRFVPKRFFIMLFDSEGAAGRAPILPINII